MKLGQAKLGKIKAWAVKKMSWGNTKNFTKGSTVNWASRPCKTTIPGD